MSVRLYGVKPASHHRAAPQLADLVAALAADRNQARRRELRHPDFAPPSILGDAEVGGHPVRMAVADGRFHTHMVGQTGSGKSTAIAEIALSDIHAGRGVVLIDPHGDLALDLLDRIPATL